MIEVFILFSSFVVEAQNLYFFTHSNEQPNFDLYKIIKRSIRSNMEIARGNIHEAHVHEVSIEPANGLIIL